MKEEKERKVMEKETMNEKKKKIRNKKQGEGYY
jgi:hypothetical protein